MDKDSLKVPPQKRLYSLDVLRGLDMFMLVGGASLLVKLVALTGADVTGLHQNLMRHAEWEGFRFHDLIFPLFMFISGVAIPYSIETKIENQVSRKALTIKIFKRMVLLIVLGMYITVYSAMALKTEGLPVCWGRSALPTFLLP